MTSTVPTISGGHLTEIAAIQAGDRLRRTAEECAALIALIDSGLLEWTQDAVIDCLRHIVRVASGEVQ